MEGPPPTPSVRSSPLVERAVRVLLAVLQVRLPEAWKAVQLATVTLWNTSSRWGPSYTEAGHRIGRPPTVPSRAWRKRLQSQGCVYS